VAVAVALMVKWPLTALAMTRTSLAFVNLMTLVYRVQGTVDTDKDGKISQSESMTACQKGELRNIQL
jgi:hypothetical protein